ncbi:MAG: zinc metallohydrolase, glyoxalase family [Gammaproteobacteria bacterium]|nr:zinc metallohydrolase, glyoxalase family [Gammaproteobacteria bacterium]
MLTYPLQPAPQPGETREVAPGVYWLRMPLPFRLNHINLWVLQDDDGWTLVDTGMHTSQSASTWQSVISGLMASRPAVRVICTHMHPDHVGMAGWLARQFDCRLWMTRLEYMTCRVLVGDTGREAPAEALRFYSGLGWSSQALNHYKSRFGSFGKMVFPLPESYRRVEDGEHIVIGGRLWHAVVGRGHSPEHLCLYCPELKLLISGDQVLPRISSNVSVFPTEPDADPLSEWLESLASIKSQIPDDVLVLPAHNEPFHELHFRIDELIATHQRRLESLYAALSTPRGAMDILKVIFRRELTGDLLLMGSGEALAHLNWLIRRGRVRREFDADGVARFQAI